jgi:glycosyltransferase involved in cell wall biosynthesis
MKVAFITIMDGLPWGGSEELWSRTALHCRQNGDSVWAGIYNWSADMPRIRDLAEAGARIELFERLVKQPKSFYRRGYERVFGNPYEKYFKVKIRDLVAFGPDVICISQGGTFNISANAGIYDFLMQTAIPFVIICQHNTEFGGGLSDSQAFHEKQLYDKAKAVLFVSERNLEIAERQLAGKLDSASVISNPLNTRHTGILPVRNDRTLRMACVARLDTAVKGQDILLAALGNDEWLTRDFHLSFYGTGADEGYLKRLIQFYGLTEKVTIAGFCKDIDYIWQQNDLLVLPSISEGTPLCLVEAMLSGRPAIATDVGGVDKYVIDGKTGYLAPVASTASLRAALERLWKDRKAMQTMGTNAYHHAFNLTDMDPMQTLREVLLDAARR